ncbi:hypothetical protein QQS21_009716 [Conoideocrella luteorostrata]|uniref:Glycan binding protein Y3-like domain-containing protein n=1 Tax=Conoideocrella luteorostrata TaxID=1105319 RepID=A0AAJ0FQ23_9HYPO|nr:hypothetical protein QQS21_009716 [Conoideocrella luteorostrata]
MQFSHLLVVAVASLGFAPAAAHPESVDSSLQKRACFKTGEKYGDQRDEAFARVREACRGYFVGTYPKGKLYTKCYNLSGNKHVKLSVGLFGHNAGKTRHLGEAECYDGLKKQVAHCDHGGEKTYGNWRYRADPNKGAC